VPVERAWRFLLDPADVAACLPGARLDSIEDERNFTGTMKVKVGPVTTEFKGKATFVEVVPEEHRVEMTASGNDQGGAGSARMTMTSRIVPGADGGCEIQVSADVDVAGKLVRFGRGMMEGIGKQMFKQFAERVQAMLALPDPAPAVAAANAAAHSEDGAAAIPDAAAGASLSPAVRAAAPIEHAPLDAGGLVWSALWAWIRGLFARLFGRPSEKG